MLSETAAHDMVAARVVRNWAAKSQPRGVAIRAIIIRNWQRAAQYFVMAPLFLMTSAKRFSIFPMSVSAFG